MSNKKKLIRERMAKTGESYQAAQRHVVVGAGGAADQPSRVATRKPRGPFETAVLRIIALSIARSLESSGLRQRFPNYLERSASRALGKHQESRRDGLLTALQDFNDWDIRKLKILMYSGREGDSLLETNNSVGSEDPDIDVSIVLGKAPLASYLRAGLRRARRDGIDIEARLPERFSTDY
jgi:hypothetical protein